MSQIRPEAIFALSSKIRWVALVDREGRTIFSQMRSGLKSYVTEEDRRVVAEIRAPFMLESVERGPDWGGRLHFISIRYDKFTELTIPLKTVYVVISVENDLSAESYKDIAKEIRDLEARQEA